MIWCYVFCYKEQHTFEEFTSRILNAQKVHKYSFSQVLQDEEAKMHNDPTNNDTPCHYPNHVYYLNNHRWVVWSTTTHITTLRCYDDYNYYRPYFSSCCYDLPRYLWWNHHHFLHHQTSTKNDKRHISGKRKSKKRRNSKKSLR